MLIDRAIIFVRAGKGGDGCVSMRREKYIPKGGPDGGDGGHGGDVIVVADPSLDTLLGFSRRPHFRAKKGGAGMGKSMHGADGDSCTIHLPVGTVIYDAETEEQIVDLTESDQRCIVAVGGRGGFGNEHFKSPTHQTPREATPGELGEEKTLRLELKLIADVGLIGLPNAGKSTLLRSISKATPRVADYPFTTLQPHLGVVEMTGERRFVVADIPGLIEGAAEGAGLGHEFLRHVERTRLLVHVLDCAPVDGSDPVRNYTTIHEELADYSEDLAAKPQIVAINKLDLHPDAEQSNVVDDLCDALGIDDKSTIVVGISGVTGHGTQTLLEHCWTELHPDPVPGWSTTSMARTEEQA